VAHDEPHVAVAAAFEPPEGRHRTVDEHRAVDDHLPERLSRPTGVPAAVPLASRNARTHRPACGNPTHGHMAAAFSRGSAKATLRVQVNHSPKEPHVPPREPTSTAAQMVRWSAGHWKIAVYGWLALVAVAFTLDTACGTTLLAVPQLNVSLLDLTSTGAVAPALPLLLFAPLVAFSMNLHVSARSGLRKATGRGGLIQDVESQGASCSCSR
jgi:hypothetical protein